MGASLSNGLMMRSHLSYIIFDPPKRLSNIPTYSQSFTQEGYSFTIIHFYDKNITMIYLIKMHGLPIESFKKNENMQFRFIFNISQITSYDNIHQKNKNNLFDFKTSAIFSFSYPFIFLPNLAIPFKINAKYVDDDSDETIFSTLKSAFKIPFYIIPKIYNTISSYCTNFSPKILFKSLIFENNKENQEHDIGQNDKLNPKICEKKIQQIERKKVINEQELHILQENFLLDDTNQVPYVGIENLGLTCYISAALHFLSSVTPFVELLLNTKTKANTTSFELQKIFVQLKMSSIVAAKEKKWKNTKRKQNKKNSNIDNGSNKTNTNNTTGNESDTNKASSNNNNSNNNAKGENDSNKTSRNNNNNKDDADSENDSNKTSRNNNNNKDDADSENDSNKTSRNSNNNKDSGSENDSNKTSRNSNNNKDSGSENDSNKTSRNNNNNNDDAGSEGDTSQISISNEINQNKEEFDLNENMNNNDNKAKMEGIKIGTENFLNDNNESKKSNNKTTKANNEKSSQPAPTPTAKSKDDKEEEEEEEELYEEKIIPVNSSCRHASSISILKFVSSFGKKLNELVFNEQDTHEFITILFDKIDSELGKKFAERRKRIFGVTLINFIRCKNADYGSEIEEELNDISLPLIGNCSSISKSLDKITSKEQMKGDNMWDTGNSKLGKQEVIRYMKFKKLPPFLTFHLMRYQQNEFTMSCEEVNSYFECPPIIDMKKYLSQRNKSTDNNNSPNTNSYKQSDFNNDCNKNNNNDNFDELDYDDDSNETRYKLMSIIAHKGSLHSGHYVSYISPTVNDHWFLFNDSFVSESSIKEVQETYGKTAANSFFGISSIFNRTSNFYSYLVGYVRLDNIKKIRYGISAPLRIVPNTLIMRYSMLVLDLSNISYDDSEKSTNSRKRITKPIYGKGEMIEWSDIDKTIEDLILTYSNKSSSKIISHTDYSDNSGTDDNSKTNHRHLKQKFFNNHQIFINYPETDYLIGPIHPNLKASDFIISGHLSQFLITDLIPEPVFICKDKEVISVESRRQVFKKFNRRYLIKYDKKIITESNYEFPVGSIITLFQREPFLLKIRGRDYEVFHDTTYEEIQRKIAEYIVAIRREKVDFDDDDFDLKYLTLTENDPEAVNSLSSRVVLYHGANVLKPRLFETVRSLHKFDSLSFRVVTEPATTLSLDMYTSLCVLFVDGLHQKHSIPSLWLSKSDTVHRLFEWSTAMLAKYRALNRGERVEDNGSSHFVLSLVSKGRILAVLNELDELDSMNEIRLDLIAAELPATTDGYEAVMDKYGIAPIEVRTVVYEPLSKRFDSIGFFCFDREETYKDLIEKVAAAKEGLKESMADHFAIETQSYYFKGFRPKYETGVFESIKKIRNNLNFKSQRPILTIQIHKNLV